MTHDLNTLLEHVDADVSALPAERRASEYARLAQVHADLGAVLAARAGEAEVEDGAEPCVISKTVFSFVVLHRSDEPFTDGPDDADWDVSALRAALDRSYDGHAVGMETHVATIPLPDEDVAAELVALHNDGEFFDQDIEDARETAEAAENEEPGD